MTGLQFSNSPRTVFIPRSSKSAIFKFVGRGEGRTSTAATLATAPTWASIQNKPTTLAGYGITDAPSGGATTTSEISDFATAVDQRIASAKPRNPTVKYERNSGHNHDGFGWETVPFRSADRVLGASAGYTHVSNGVISVPYDGVYLVSASAAFVNVPSGDIKFILQITTGGVSRYLTRGTINLPAEDFWGASGVTTLSLEAGDALKFELFFAGIPGGVNLPGSLTYNQADLTIAMLNG